MARKIFKKDGTVEFTGVTVEKGSLGTSGFRIKLDHTSIPQEVPVYLNNSGLIGSAKLFVHKNEIKADIAVKEEFKNYLDHLFPSVSGKVKRKSGVVHSINITHISLDTNKNSDLTIKSLKEQVVEIERQL